MATQVSKVYRSRSETSPVSQVPLFCEKLLKLYGEFFSNLYSVPLLSEEHISKRAVSVAYLYTLLIFTWHPLDILSKAKGKE